MVDKEYILVDYNEMGIIIKKEVRNDGFRNSYAGA